VAITIDQGNLGTANSAGTLGSVTVTTAATAAVGSFIVLNTSIFGDGSVLTSVSGGGLSWVVDRGHLGAAAFRKAWARAYAPAGLASGTVITPTFDTTDAGVSYTFGLTSLLGVKSSSPLDVADAEGAGQSFSGTNSWNTSTLAVQAGSIVLGNASKDDDSTGNTPTSPAVDAWDLGGEVVSYRIEASAGSYNVAGTFQGVTSGVSIFAGAIAYLAEATYVPAGEAGPTLINVHANRQTW